MHKFIKTASIMITLSYITIIPHYAQASPVLLEIFGETNCGDDPAAQEQIAELLKTHKNLIVLNCRGRIKGSNGDLKYARNECIENGKAYAKRLDAMGYKNPTIVINGKWVAYAKDIKAALPLGALDKLDQIDLTLEDNALNINIPESTKNTSGQIYIYSYMPSVRAGQNVARIDPDLELTDDLKNKIAANKSVPFVTREDVADTLYVRPLLEKQYIGKWDGKALRMNYPVLNITNMTDMALDKISYGVVIHESDEFSPVIAAGEFVSPFESNGLLPHSTPIVFEKISAP